MMAGKQLPAVEFSLAVEEVGSVWDDGPTMLSLVSMGVWHNFDAGLVTINNPRPGKI